MSSIKDDFKEDDIGRTNLFYAVAQNNISEVERIIYGLSGTGLGGQRRAAISHKDHMNINVIDLAKKMGHEEIRKLLSIELARMEFYE